MQRKALFTPDDSMFLQLICFRDNKIQGKPKIKKCLCDRFFSLVPPAVNKGKSDHPLTCNLQADCEEVAKSKGTPAQGTVNEDTDGLTCLSESPASLCALQRGAPTSLE